MAHYFMENTNILSRRKMDMKKIRNGKKGLLLLALTFMLTLMFGMTTMAAAKTVSLSNNKWYTDKSTDFKRPAVYHKIRIPRSGLITVTGYTYSNYSTYRSTLKVQLYNSKKKPLQKYKKYTALYNYKTYYAVKKGVYYIKTQDNRYKLKYSYKAVSDNRGSSKAKARTINKNKLTKGLLVAGEKGSKVDWYKIVLTKPQNLKITYSALANELIQFKIIPDSTNILISNSSAFLRNNKQIFSSRSAFPAGTYYIQVFRYGNSTDCSGYYTLKWK